MTKDALPGVEADSSRREPQPSVDSLQGIGSTRSLYALEEYAMKGEGS